MTPEQKAAFINAQAASMLVEKEGMKVTNRERINQGYALAYDELSFLGLIDKYGLGHNALMDFFRS